MKTDNDSREHHRKSLFELGGWVVFVFSAACYIVSAWKAGDPLSIIGGMLFLGACVLFLIPLLSSPAPYATQGEEG